MKNSGGGKLLRGSVGPINLGGSVWRLGAFSCHTQCGCLPLCALVHPHSIEDHAGHAICLAVADTCVPRLTATWPVPWPCALAFTAQPPPSTRGLPGGP